MFWLIVAFYSGCNSCTTGKKVANFDFFGQTFEQKCQKMSKEVKVGYFFDCFK